MFYLLMCIAFAITCVRITEWVISQNRVKWKWGGWPYSDEILEETIKAKTIRNTHMLAEIQGYTLIPLNWSGVVLSLNGRLVKSMHKDFFDRLYM